MMRVKKGDVVLVRAVISTKNDPKPYSANWPGEIIHQPDDEIKSGYHNRQKRVMRRHTLINPMECLVVGRSTRITGMYHMGIGSYDNFDPGYLYNTTTHKVIIVQPMDTQRYIKPYACLEEDIVDSDQVI